MTILIRILFFGGAVSASILFASCGSRSTDAMPGKAAQSSILVVNGVVVTPQQLENVVRSSGTVLASESVDLTAEAAGRVDRVLFQEGRHVGKDELLVKINDDDLQAQLKKTGLQIQLASEQEKRQKRLFEGDGISREQYDISLNQVNTLRADLEFLQASIRKREIRAPFDGVIGLRYVSEGGYVSQTTRIASIQKINPMKVDFAIPEKYADQVAVGNPVQFTSSELKLQFAGKLYAIEPKIDPATRTVQLRAFFSNAGEKIFPGAYVQIELHLKKIPDAIMVPTQAVIPVLKGQTVLVCKNGVVNSRPVTMGIRTASAVQITSGVDAGDTVITTGVMQLRAGMPVRVEIR